MSSPAWASEFEDYAAGLCEEAAIPGLTVAAARHGEIVYQQGFGHRDLENQLPVTPGTIMGIGSVTKSFTAVGIMILEQEGKLSTGDPVSKYLPSFRLPGDLAPDGITIHHFLTHTSGLAPQPLLWYAMIRSQEGDPSMKELEESGMLEKLKAEPPIDTYDQLMERLAASPIGPLGAAGKQFSYSNDAYSLLGTIIEQVSGQSYTSFIEERILEPLGMDRSFFSLERLQQEDNVTNLYAGSQDSDRHIYHAPQWNEAPAMLAAGFLRSTVVDLTKYGDMYLGGGKRRDGERILKPQQAARMAAPYFPIGRDYYYGYGLMVQPGYHGRTLVEHGGAIKGVAAQFGYVPEEDLTVAVLANLGGVPSSQIWLGAVNLMLGLPVDTPRWEYPEVQIPVEYLREYAGSYRSGEGSEISIGLDGGQLVAQVEGDRMALKPTGVDTVKMSYHGRDLEARFGRGPGGSVDSLHFGFRIIGRVSDLPPVPEQEQDEQVNQDQPEAAGGEAQ